MKKVTAVLAILVLLAATVLTLPVQAANSGHWVFDCSILSTSEPYTGLTRSVKTTPAEKSAEFITAGANKEYEKCSTAWSVPAVKEDGAIELQLVATIIEAVNCSSPQVTICAYIGKPGQDVTSVSGDVRYLTDKDGKYTCLTASPGTAALTVSGSLGTGEKGGQKAIYVMSYNNGQIAQCQYIYKWVLAGETAVQTESAFVSTAASVSTAAVAGGTTAALETAAVIAPTASGSTDSVAFSNFKGSGLTAAVVIGALLIAAIMLILIRKKQKAGQGLTARPLNVKNMQKFSRIRRKWSNEDDFDDGYFSVLCPSCQTKMKKGTMVCPNCGRPVK